MYDPSSSSGGRTVANRPSRRRHVALLHRLVNVHSRIVRRGDVAQLVFLVWWTYGGCQYVAMTERSPLSSSGKRTVANRTSMRRCIARMRRRGDVWLQFVRRVDDARLSHRLVDVPRLIRTRPKRTEAGSVIASGLSASGPSLIFSTARVVARFLISCASPGWVWAASWASWHPPSQWHPRGRPACTGRTGCICAG